MTQYKRFLLNIIFNLFGLGLPLVAGLYAIPILIHSLGLEKFGILSLSWMFIGYFSLFDMGLGRALTQATAVKIGLGQKESIPPLFWTAILLMTIVSFFGSWLLIFLADRYILVFLKIPIELHQQTIASLYLLATSLPFVVTTTALCGQLEAVNRFAFINIARVILGIVTFLGPVFILPFTTKLNDIVTVLLVARVAIWVMHLIYIFLVFPELKQISFQKELLKPLLRFGGWLTVSNIIGPIMVYFDRFVIGALLSLVAVSYYTTPYEIISKLLLISAALLGVIFPIFARYQYRQKEDRRVLVKYYSRGEFLLAATMSTLILLIVNYSNMGLSLWLDEQFAINSSLVLNLLALGVYFNSIAQVSLALLQGVGRADLSAKAHLLEVVIYLPSLLWATTYYGIVGVAFVWMVRAIVDTVLLQVMSRYLIPEIASNQSKIIFFNILFSSSVGILIIGGDWKLSFMTLLIVVAALLTALYFCVLPKSDKSMVENYFRQFFYPSTD